MRHGGTVTARSSAADAASTPEPEPELGRGRSASAQPGPGRLEELARACVLGQTRHRERGQDGCRTGAERLGRALQPPPVPVRLDGAGRTEPHLMRGGVQGTRSEGVQQVAGGDHGAARVQRFADPVGARRNPGVCLLYTSDAADE